MKIPALDGLRGIAAIIVLVSHYSNGHPEFLDGRLGFGGGQIGVMLFFLISGFLMEHLYGCMPATSKNIFGFTVRRVARVVPLYLFAVFVYFAANRSGLQLPIVTTDNLVEHLLFLRGASVLWTVPVEVQFYIGFVLLWLMFQPFNKTSQVIFIASAVAFFAMLPTTPHNVPRLFYCVHYFLLGVLIAEISVSWSLDVSERVADAVFLASLPATVLVFPNILGESHPLVWHAWAPMIVLPLLLASSLASPMAARTLGSWPMRQIGNISYSIYIWHLLILEIIGTPFGPYGTFFFFLLLVIIASALSFRMIELPARAFIVDLARKAEARKLTRS